MGLKRQRVGPTRACSWIWLNHPRIPTKNGLTTTNGTCDLCVIGAPFLRHFMIVDCRLTVYIPVHTPLLLVEGERGRRGRRMRVRRSWTVGHVAWCETGLGTAGGGIMLCLGDPQFRSAVVTNTSVMMHVAVTWMLRDDFDIPPVRCHVMSRYRMGTRRRID